MNMKEKLLNLIGLEPMTNRDRLIEELYGLSGEQLYQVLSGSRGAMMIDDAQCATCHRMHDGECPKPDDVSACVLTIGAWLDMAWDGASILAEVHHE